jgi:putative oxidoreductase
MLIDTRYSEKALALLRIVAALLFIQHATSKLFNFPPFPGPVPSMGSLLWIAGVIELVGGLLLLFGLLSRPVAFLLSGEMAIAYFMAHAPKSTFPMLNGGEAAILLCFTCLMIAATGPGEWSVDKARSKRVVHHREGEKA